MIDLVFGDDYLDELETFDNISCQLPPFALLKQFYENMPENLECDREDSKLKRCFYVIELELDEVIDIVFMDGNAFRRWVFYSRVPFKEDLTQSNISKL